MQDTIPRGGGSTHDLGYYADESALTTAHPSASDGDFARVGSTDTVWMWDSDTGAWVDTGGTAASLYNSNPEPLGTAATGASDKASPGDHVHQMPQLGSLQADTLANLNAKVSDATLVPESQKGAADGVAELDSGAKIPQAQLPSYVDDVIEYATSGDFPATGETGKIYVAQDTNKTYRWSGSAYVEISESLALGTTSSTAYRGDRGKTAYDHSQEAGTNPHAVTHAGLSGGVNSADHHTRYADTEARAALHGQSDLGNLGASPSPTLTPGWIHTATVSENLSTWDNLSLSDGDVVTLRLSNSGSYTVSTTGLTAATSGGLSAIEAATVDLTIWQINSTRYAIATEVP